MNDDLRTRIAATIEAQHVSEYQGGIHPEDVLRLADAVIAELGLREELKYPGRFTFMPPQRRRYVTEWETDA